MTDHDRNLIRRIFFEVVELPPLQRAAALDRLCAGNAHLRTEVERLLRADADAEDFMSRPTGAGMDVIASELPTASIAPITEKPGEIIGPYKLLQVIGEGGFGTVFMAEQQKPVVRKVALKIIKLGMDTRQVVARFEQERQALALMDHPNIAKVFDGGATDSGRPYFVMELVRGVPITEYADANNLSPQERLELFIPVCHAVQHAHHKGVIHRDIKPSNILVTLHDGKPVPKVIDFGVAKATQSRLTEKTLFTEHKQLIGTPAYMAPEQAELSGLDIDTRADVYALGVLLYELLTGTTPFDATSLLEAGYAEMQRIIREVEPPKPSTRVATLGGDIATTTAAKRRIEPTRFAPLLRGDLDWMVMKALEKDRTRRYDTAVDFVQDIERHLAGEPVVAAPPSAAYRVRKFVRRNKARVILAASISLCVVAAVGVSTIMWLKTEREVRFREAQIRYSEMFGSGWWDVQHGNLDQGSRKMRDGLEGWESLLGGGNREVIARWAQYSELMCGHGVTDEGLRAADHGMKLRIKHLGEADVWTIGFARQAAWAAECAGDERARESFLRDGAMRALLHVPLGKQVRREATWDYAAWLAANERQTEALPFMNETVLSLEQEEGVDPHLLQTARAALEAIQQSREARAKLEPVITQRLRGGAGIAELREAYAADQSLTPEERTAAMAILFQKQQDAQRPPQSPQPADRPFSNEP
jgi:serine/threonine protein kinase